MLHQYQYTGNYNNDTLYGLDGQSGKLLWNITVLDGGATTLIRSSGQLLLAAQFHPNLQSTRLLGIDPLNGRIQWSVDEPKYSINFPVGEAILTYDVTAQKGVTAFDASTGTPKWAQANAPAPLSVAYGNGAIFLWTTTGLMALDAASGTQKWVRPIANTYSCLSFASGTLLAQGFGNHTISMVGLSASDGRTLWNTTYPHFNNYGKDCPALENGQLLFLAYPPYDANASAQLIALTASAGIEQWRNPAFQCRNYPENMTNVFGCYIDVHIDSTAVGDGLIFLANASQYSDTEYNSTVYALSAGSGNVLWTHTFQNASYVRMTYANGTLYTAASPSGQVAAFRNQTLPVPEFPSPVIILVLAVAAFSTRFTRSKRNVAHTA